MNRIILISIKYQWNGYQLNGFDVTLKWNSFFFLSNNGNQSRDKNQISWEKSTDWLRLFWFVLFWFRLWDLSQFKLLSIRFDFNYNFDWFLPIKVLSMIKEAEIKSLHSGLDIYQNEKNHTHLARQRCLSLMFCYVSTFTQDTHKHTLPESCRSQNSSLSHSHFGV